MAGETQLVSYTQTTFTTTGGAMTNTWPAWNLTYTTFAGTTDAATNVNLVTNQVLWTQWTQTYAISTAYTSIGSNGVTIYQWENWNDRYQVRKDATEAEIKAVAERRKERAVARAAQVAGARRRAEDLLRRHLTAEQREDLEKKNCFYLESITKKGERRKYRIDRGTHGNVKLLDKDGRIIGSYCVQPDGVPAEDAMLAQKLWLETDEEKFVKVANFSRHG